MNLPDWGASWNFQMRCSRGREFLKALWFGRLIHRPSEILYIFTTCRMHHLILPFTNIYYLYIIKKYRLICKINHISSDYLFTKLRRVRQRSSTNHGARWWSFGSWAVLLHQKLYHGPPANAFWYSRHAVNRYYKYMCHSTAVDPLARFLNCKRRNRGFGLL